MGTRSLTHIKDDVWEDGQQPGPTIVTIYRQMDGYPSGHGKELAKFLAGRTIVNGFGSGTPGKASNGMGCLAATLVGHLKGDSIGGIYLYPPDSEDCGEEYIYTISNSATRTGSGINLKVEAVRGGYGDKPRTLTVLFDGPPEEFSAEKAEALRV
jgi:hypothetical protein